MKLKDIVKEAWGIRMGGSGRHNDDKEWDEGPDYAGQPDERGKTYGQIRQSSYNPYNRKPKYKTNNDVISINIPYKHKDAMKAVAKKLGIRLMYNKTKGWHVPKTTNKSDLAQLQKHLTTLK